MKLYRIAAIMERDMRKFFRNPMLMIATMVFPLTQLIVLGYAFGGKIKGVEVALVDQDGGPQSLMIRQRLDTIASGPQTFRTIDYNSLPDAVRDLRTGFVRAVIYIPPDYSRRVQQRNRPRIAFIEDNTDNFMSNELHARMQELVMDVKELSARLG